MKILPTGLKKADINYWFLAVLAAGIAYSVILMVSGTRPASLWMFKMILKGREPMNHDSWNPMILALRHLQQNSPGSVYDVLFNKGVKFQYPLSSLFVFDLTNRLTGLSFESITYILNHISRIAIFFIALISARILDLLLREKRFESIRPSSTSGKILLYGLVILQTLMFYPLLQSYFLGQIQTLLTLFVVLAILCWQSGRKGITGILFGFICLIKPQLGLIFIWAAIRKQWPMVISGLTVITVFTLLSLVCYGFDNNLQYLKVISFLSRHGESYYANQSVNGLLNRLLFNGSNLIWDEKFPPYSPLIYSITLISSLIFMAFGLGWNYKDQEPGPIDLSIVLLSLTMASPIAWEHHYAILVPLFIILSPFAFLLYQRKVWPLFILGLGFMLSSKYIESAKQLADTPFNILQSYLFFGSLIVLLFLFRTSYLSRTTISSR